MGERRIDRLYKRYSRQRDVAALGEVFDLAAPELMRVARHLCRDESEAEDAVQATFLTALVKPHAFDESRRLLPWLLGILALHARDARRRAGRTPEPDRVENRPAADPFEEAADSEFDSAVREVVADLPDTYRGVLVAHLAEGKPPREIAREFGLSPVATRVRLHRGMKLLRRALPAGFAVTTAVMVTPSRGLAAVREQVLAEASRIASLAPAAPAASIATFGALRWVLGGAAALTVAAGAHLALQNPRSSERPIRETEQNVQEIALEADGSASTQLSRTGRSALGTRSPSPTTATLHPIRARVVGWPDHSPLVGAEVFVVAADSEGLGSSHAPASSLRTTTDARGEFSLADVPLDAGLFVRAEGYASWRQRVLLNGPLGGELGDIALPRGARIAGQVVDASGAAVPDAQIFVVADFLDWNSLPPALHELARAGADGSFLSDDVLPYSAERYARISSIDPGDCAYELVAVSAAGVGRVRTLVHEGSELQDAVRIPLSPLVMLEAHVRDREGESVSGATVWSEGRWSAGLAWHRGDAKPRFPRALAQTLMATTDADGIARWSTVQPGPTEQVLIEAVAPGDGEPGSSSGTQRPQRARVRMSSVELGSPIVMALEELRGGLLRGEVRSMLDAPLAGAEVLVDGEVVAESSADGSYEAPFVETQSLLVSVRAPGHESAQRTLSMSEQRTLASPGERLDWGLQALDASRRVTGLLLDESGRGVPGIEVILDGSSSRRTAFSDETGAFTLDVEGGELRLEVLAPRDRWRPMLPRLLQPEDNHVTVELIARTLRGVEVIARVRHARTAAPLDADRAALVPREATAGALNSAPEVSLSAGHVTLAGVQPGTWRLWVARRDLGIGYADIDITSDSARQTVDVWLDSGARVTGRISDPQASSVTLTMGYGGPLPDAADLAQSERTDYMSFGGFCMERTLPIAADGSFEAEGLLPGPWSLELGEDGLRGSTTFEALAGLTEHVELEVLQPGELALRLAASLDTGGVIVHVKEDDRPWRSTEFVQHEDLEGELRVPVRPGTIRWRVEFKLNTFPESQKATFSSATGEGKVLPGGTTDVLVPLEPVGSSSTGG